MEDDVYPNNGEFVAGVPREPIEQALSRKKEKAQAAEFSTVLQDLLSRWEDKIKFYESVRAIPEEVKLKPEEFMQAVTLNAVIVEILEAEKEYIESIIIEKSR